MDMNCLSGLCIYIYFQSIERGPKLWPVQCFPSKHWISMNFMIDIPKQTDIQIKVSFILNFKRSSSSGMIFWNHYGMSSMVATAPIYLDTILQSKREPPCCSIGGRSFFSLTLGPNLLVRWTVRTRWAAFKRANRRARGRKNGVL